MKEPSFPHARTSLCRRAPATFVARFSQPVCWHSLHHTEISHERDTAHGSRQRSDSLAARERERERLDTALTNRTIATFAGQHVGPCTPPSTPHSRRSPRRPERPTTTRSIDTRLPKRETSSEWRCKRWLADTRPTANAPSTHPRDTHGLPQNTTRRQAEPSSPPNWYGFIGRLERCERALEIGEFWRLAGQWIRKLILWRAKLSHTTASYRSCISHFIGRQ